MVIALPQAQPQMLFLDYPGRPDHFDLTREKQWRRVSVTERLKHFVTLEKIDSEVRERQLVIEAQRGLQLLIRKQFTRG